MAGARRPAVPPHVGGVAVRREQPPVQPDERRNDMLAIVRERNGRDVDRLRRVRILRGGPALELGLDGQRLGSRDVRPLHPGTVVARRVDRDLRTRDLLAG